MYGFQGSSTVTNSYKNETKIILNGRSRKASLFSYNMNKLKNAILLISYPAGIDKSDQIYDSQYVLKNTSLSTWKV